MLGPARSPGEPRGWLCVCERRMPRRSDTAAVGSAPAELPCCWPWQTSADAQTRRRLSL